MRKLNLLLGITIVLLFMIPVSLALAMTSASQTATIDNGTYYINPNDQIVHTHAIVDATNAGCTFDVASMVQNISGANLPADFSNQTPAQNTSGITEEVASMANKNVDGATIKATRNADTASADHLSINAIHSSVKCNTFVENTADIRSWSTGADAQQFKSEVAFVPKIEISAGATVDINGLADYTWARSDNVDLSGTATNVLKKPINLVNNNTPAPTYTVSPGMADTVSDPSTASATIDYSFPLARQAVDSSTMISTTSGITTPNLAMINPAAAIYFTDITVTAMVQNQETAAYANDLVVAVVNNTFLAATVPTAGNTGTETTMLAGNTPMIDTDVTMTRPMTTLYAGMNAKGVVGDGLVAPIFA
ncbi:MAG: hypothetical protein PHZ04_03360 [Patescibacteria group bacterium]|nr:hypothetical protein [Patescibacteria group bacterium]MDD5554210.1 hypothetical protein [Patescibacteria group bacterium]